MKGGGGRGLTLSMSVDARNKCVCMCCQREKANNQIGGAIPVGSGE